MVRSSDLAEGPPRRRVVTLRRDKISYDRRIRDHDVLKRRIGSTVTLGRAQLKNELARSEGFTALRRDLGALFLPGNDSADQRLGGPRREAGKPGVKLWIDLSGNLQLWLHIDDIIRFK